MPVENRRTQRIEATMKTLTDAGHKPVFKESKDPQVEDDVIEIGNGISIQLNSESGDAVAVSKPLPNRKIAYYDVNLDSELLPAVQKAIAH